MDTVNHLETRLRAGSRGRMSCYFGVLVAFALLSGASFARPNWPQVLGLDFWNLPKIEAELHQEQRRCVELTARLASTLLRMDLKEKVIDEVVTGRLTLFEAAGQFRCIEIDNPGGLRTLRTTFACKSNEEAYCLCVISYCEVRLQDCADKGQMVINQYRNELAAALNSGNGNINLP